MWRLHYSTPLEGCSTFLPHNNHSSRHTLQTFEEQLDWLQWQADLDAPLERTDNRDIGEMKKIA